MAKTPFSKMRGLPDKTLTQALVNQHQGLQYHANVINHHGKVLILVVTLALVEAAAVVYLLLS